MPGVRCRTTITSAPIASMFFAVSITVSPLERLLVAGDSGNDAEMLTAGALGVVVGNHSPELAPLRNRSGIYFATEEHAAGVLEGIEHHGFYDLVQSTADSDDGSEDD